WLCSLKSPPLRRSISNCVRSMEPYPTLPFYLPSLRVIYDDFHPLLELCNEINASEVEGIDLSVRSSCSLEDQYVLSLIRSVNQKLHLVDVHDCFGKTLWRDVFSQGLSCEVLNVRSLHFRKLNIVGEFAQLHTLILDSNRVTGFGESFFSCMPNLTCLSMCDTVVSELWTASAALLKLPSLEVLWFQIWICCSESSSGGGGGSSAAPRQRNTTSITAAAAIGMQPVTVPISFRRREESQMNRGERQLAPEVGCEYSSPITLSKLHGRCKKLEVEELMYPRYRF
ncbi:unnamed protein product, partial [Brassica oleracea]